MKRILLALAFLSANFAIAQNVSLVCDINPGTASGSPFTLTAFNNMLCFYADSGANGVELYKYDGACAMVQDMNPSGNGMDFMNFGGDMIAFGNKLFFKINNVTNGYEIFSYDGTTVSLAANIGYGAQHGDPRGFVLMNSKIYFNATDTNNNGFADYELWEFDPSNNSTAQRSNIHPNGNAHPGSLCQYNNKLYFSAFNLVNGHELWCYNPSNQTNTMIDDINAGIYDSYPQSLLSLNGVIYFTASTTTYGRELYSYDGTGVPQRLTDLNPGSGNGFSGKLFVYNGDMYFRGDDGTGGKLYKFSTQTNTPSLVSSVTNPTNFAYYNNNLYFTASTTQEGSELHMYDGSNVTMVVDLNTGTGSSSPNYCTVLNGKLYFAAYTPATGNELWVLNDFAANVTTTAYTEAEINIFPNPASDEASISFKGNTGGKVNIEVTDITGRRVYNTTGTATANTENKFHVSLSNCAIGTYYCRISYNNGASSYNQVIIKK